MGKRSSIFDKLAEIDSSDQKAAKRKKNTQGASIAQSHAARSQLEQTNILVESRILLQRAVGAVQSYSYDELSSSSLKTKHADDAVTELMEARSTLMSSTTGADDVPAKNMDEKLQSQYEQCREMWKKVLNKRQEDLNLASGKTTSKKFQVIDQGVWGQIEATVAHEKLRQKVLSEEEGSSDADEKDRYSFDDGKIYQQMLKDFIANGASASASSRAEAEKTQGKLNGKTSKKKVVDRRASKDRRLKYTVNEKLQNFTFPIARPVPLIDEDDWFKSLFGGAWKKQQKVVKQIRM